MLPELAGRKINGDANWRQPDVAPRDMLAAGGANCPLANVHHHARLLENGYELDGRNRAQFRRVPAHQRLDPCNQAAPKVQLGLVVKREFPALLGPDQTVLEDQALLDLFVEVGSVKLIVGLALIRAYPVVTHTHYI